MCDRWHQAAGQRNFDLHPARSAGLSRLEIPGRSLTPQSLVSLSEPMFRKPVPIKNMATALGLAVVLQFRFGFLRSVPVRSSADAANIQPKHDEVQHRNYPRNFFRQSSLLPQNRLSLCARVYNVLRKKLLTEHRELSDDHLRFCVLGSVPYDGFWLFDFGFSCPVVPNQEQETAARSDIHGRQSSVSLTHSLRFQSFALAMKADVFRSRNRQFMSMKPRNRSTTFPRSVNRASPIQRTWHMHPTGC